MISMSCKRQIPHSKLSLPLFLVRNTRQQCWPQLKSKSLFVIVGLCNLCYCMSLNAIVCLCMSVYVFVCLCMSLYVIVCLCMSLCVFVYLCMSLYVIVQQADAEPFQSEGMASVAFYSPDPSSNWKQSDPTEFPIFKWKYGNIKRYAWKLWQVRHIFHMLQLFSNNNQQHSDL